MAGQSGDDNPVGINVTALVDIIFCLCLFFMCSLKFKELDGKLDSWMPQTVGTQSGVVTNMPRDEMRILLSFDERTGRLDRLYGPRPIEAGTAGDRLLETLIRADAEHFRSLGQTDVPLIIDAGTGVSWNDIVTVMDIARGASVPKIEFAAGSAVPSKEPQTK